MLIVFKMCRINKRLAGDQPLWHLNRLASCIIQVVLESFLLV